MSTIGSNFKSDFSAAFSHESAQSAIDTRARNERPESHVSTAVERKIPLNGYGLIGGVPGDGVEKAGSDSRFSKFFGDGASATGSSGPPASPLGEDFQNLAVSLGELVQWEDAGASAAIARFRKNELSQSLALIGSGYRNSTTGEELAGVVLAGTADIGNEAQELRQMKRLAGERSHLLTESGKRVAGVIDHYLALAESRGGSLTGAEKAQMAADLSGAARYRLGDDISQVRQEGTVTIRPFLRV